MQVARDVEGGEALMAITVDSSISADVLSAVAKETGADFVRSVNLVS